ncbi:ribosomal protein S18 acetylase RimI-like enzyme [Clostridium beijerinckii]|uniref:GNAT family N-acetyltransferase n=2 Tax=Clostridium beijerinckii TaxID=1520 RepID=UPI0014945A1C|nr:GNAT family N-acetyltransferase [Clostridium beijerinckii]NOW90308.1 ribosomal protein S18 acetylase RimI-like enzyme [Clostridium beijerinckii]
MSLKYIKARKEDAEMLIEIYNESFYDDYIKYGECPAYGKTIESMKESIERFPKFIIYCDDIPVGVISVSNRGDGEYHIGCLCVIPKYQRKGIGAQAVKYMLGYYTDWSKITLITPVDKEKNINFYTKKLGLIINGMGMDGNVRVVHFLMKRGL